MQAILYVGHGSRVKAGNDELLAFVEKAKNEHPQISIQECCFLELAEPTIEEGVQACVKQGATKIAVVPLLLLTAMHAKVDIPEAIDKMKEKYPEVRFSYGRPIGIESTVVTIVKDRLRAAGFDFSNERPKYEERKPISILLVGRGSSDPDQTSDLMKIARLVWEYTPVDEVDVCFLAATRPNVEEGLVRMNRLPNHTVYVVPYLLFTGVLMKELKEQLDEWSKQTDKQFILCDYLGFDDQLVSVLGRRVQEVLEERVQVNCDTCNFRVQPSAIVGSSK
ncbi:sirohydrochlorin chelatase [Alkalihalobacillus sp. MEB130]|uniref:sirohydrochlorin chelatase n=1 Tax=Alkalihalobacillus sp. MEB130 TaxID=2976704 RepID=UPI0028DE7866|nr:sirohydrochlorin chelatase [Alkalihalobacillus sp. MEB130]MDT8859879.1 sirohydrochlorin chelatase [Alkalihalobacillus sp. MEB130]